VVSGGPAPPNALPDPPRRSRDGGSDQSTAVHPAAGATITIGRDAGCDIVVSDLLVSRRHAELRRVDQTWRLVDLNSWNGSFVNGQRGK